MGQCDGYIDGARSAMGYAFRRFCMPERLSYYTAQTIVLSYLAISSRFILVAPLAS